MWILSLSYNLGAIMSHIFCLILREGGKGTVGKKDVKICF